MKRIIAVMVLLLILCGCASSQPQAGKDEILLKIQLDLKEDIGLLVLDAELDGKESSGGVSNADRSLLKKDDLLYWTFDRQEYETEKDSVSLTMRFRIITEYCDPNFENIYPEEYTILLEPLSFDADFSSSYDILIREENAENYQAYLE